MENEIENLETQIAYYATKYYAGEPEISDEQFDALVDKLRSLNPRSKVLKTGWGFEVNGDKVKHRYFPDFKIGDLIFELKGDQFFNENGIMQNPYDHSQDKCFAEKQKCMMKNNVILLKSSEYQMFELYVKQKYGCNYLKQFKVSKKQVNNDCNEKRNQRQQI